MPQIQQIQEVWFKVFRRGSFGLLLVFNSLRQLRTESWCPAAEAMTAKSEWRRERVQIKPDVRTKHCLWIKFSRRPYLSGSSHQFNKWSWSIWILFHRETPGHPSLYLSCWKNNLKINVIDAVGASWESSAAAGCTQPACLQWIPFKTLCNKIN